MYLYKDDNGEYGEQVIRFGCGIRVKCNAEGLQISRTSITLLLFVIISILYPVHDKGEQDFLCKL